MTTHNNFGDLLEDLFRTKDKQKQDLANHLDVKPPRISQLLSSKNAPRESYVLKQIEAFFFVKVHKSPSGWYAVDEKVYDLPEGEILSVQEPNREEEYYVAVAAKMCADAFDSAVGRALDQTPNLYKKAVAARLVQLARDIGRILP